MNDEVAVEFFDGSSDNEVRKLLCSRCRTKTNHTVKHSYRQKWMVGTAPYIDIQGVDDFFIVQCNGCETIQFCKVSSNSEDISYVEDPTTGEVDTFYPDTIEQYPAITTVFESPIAFVSMPTGVKKAYQETYLALANNLPKLSAIGIRLLVELICLSFEVPQNLTLFDKINRLQELGIISEDMKKLLQKIRLFGNDGAHTDQLPTTTDLSNAWAAINTLIRYLYGTKDTADYFGAKQKKSKSTGEKK
jgi:hypothetical protein